MRTTVRRRLVLYGLCASASGGLLGWLLIVFFDWWLWLPAVLRLAIGVSFAAVCIALILRWVVRPLRARIALSALTGRLERHFPSLGDALTSAVSFLEAGEAAPPFPARKREGWNVIGSEALIQRVIDNTARVVQPIPLERALTRKPLARGALMVLLAAASAVMLAWAAPGWFATGLARYVVPFGAREWPRKVDIQPLPSATKVALGDALPIRMQITRGMDEDLRGIVRVRDVDGDVSTFTMQREPPADFYCTIDALVGDLVYWFEAGDASTADAPCRVTVVKRPAVLAAGVRVVAPAYVQPRAPEERDLAGGEVRAVTGSALTVSVRSSKPVGINGEGRPNAYLEFDGSPAVRLELENHDPTRLAGSFTLCQDDAFRIVLKDQDGFENDARRNHRVIAMPDEPPAVTVVEPSAVTEIAPSGSVTLVARAEDDFGIREVRLTGELLNRPASIDLPLADNPPVSVRGSGLMAELRYVWELAPLDLAAGDVLVYRLAVTDNYAYQGARGQSTTSPPLRLKVIAKMELENRLRDEFALLEARIRQALLDQEALGDELDALAETTSGAPAAEPGDSSAPSMTDELGPARRMGRQQLRLADQLRRLAERFQRIGERARLNDAFDEQTRRQVGEVTKQLHRTASGSMTQAARALERLADEVSSSASERLGAVASAQASAIDELQRVLRWVGRWGDFQEVVAKARDLLDRQQQVRAAALRQGRNAVGKPFDALTDEEQTHLRRVVRQERQLAQEMDEWMRKSRSLIPRAQTKDSAAGEALQGALRAAVAHRVLARMEQAAAALADNRTAAASLEQRAVESGLTKVLAVLEARQVRELAELRKSVERMLDAVAELLRRQEELVAAVEEAVGLASPSAELESAADAFAALADEQRALRRNTGQLGEEIGASPPAAKAAAAVTRAVAPMERAERKLRASTRNGVVTDQGEAVASLRAALEELQLLAAQTEHRIMQNTLAQTRHKLEDIRDRQEEVNGASGELVSAMRGRRRLSRADARRATHLAAKQADIREETAVVRGELDSVAVYTWVLDRVGETMGLARAALAERRLVDVLVDNQHRIVSELSQLIDALASIEELPPLDEFVDGAGGGGGGAVARNQPPVPPVAELIVIRTMQAALNEKTVQMHANLAGAEPTEADLRQARALGWEQEQLRTLTERVTRKARTGD